MKFSNYLVAVSVAGMVTLASCNNSTTRRNSVNLSNEIDSVSYSLGVSIGSGMQSQGMETLNYDAFVKAIQDVMENDSVLISNQQANMMLNSYFQNLHTQRVEKNKEAGEQFLAENKAKDGVQTTQSGLQYKVLQEGAGQTPTADDVVTVHYTGKLINGKVFDSSVERGEPATFGVNQVIPGWTEALQLMRVGSKYQLYIPSDLAYGPRGAGQDIGPNETLIFDVELLSIGDQGADGNN
jgi:FKBP-type peptidyl-prolyl cis-trans isomerase FklB